MLRGHCIGGDEMIDTRPEYPPEFDEDSYEEMAEELARLRKVEAAARWMHTFISRDATFPDDGEQWDAIETELLAALEGDE